MVRCIIGAICGAVAGGVFNMAVIMLSWVIYPPLAGANMNDPATLNAYVQTLPLPAFLLILVAHAGGAFVGGLVAALIARKWRLILGAIVGGFFLIGGILGVMEIPAPLWFAIVDLISYVPCGMLGASVVSLILRPAQPPPNMN